MARFQDIAKGKRARRATTLSIGEASVALEVRVLGPDEDLAIAAAALSGAKARGSVDPGRGEPLYEALFRAHTLALACVDKDSPADAPAPFFSSVEEILTSEDLTRDHIAWLFEEQERWQDECSPRQKTLTTAQYIATVARLAEGDDLPFIKLSPGAQVSFVRSTAKQLWSSLVASSPSSSPSGETDEKLQ